MRKLSVPALLSTALLMLLLPVVVLADDAGVALTHNAGSTGGASAATTTVAPGAYAVLAGGALMVAAFFVRRLTTGWFHTQTGGLVLVLASTVLTSCAEAVQRHGLSWSVLVTAAGSAALTFVAMSNARQDPKTGGAA